MEPLLGRQRNARGNHLALQIEAKNIPRQAFVMINISCKFTSTYNTFCSRGVTRKSLYTVEKVYSYA